ncbi:hypothetical protein BJV77DRAFT_963761 [Russula vinacea]|nr:hypothetical protein BJV77DRAFT_963761 [Russula vinacea]
MTGWQSKEHGAGLQAHWDQGTLTPDHFLSQLKQAQAKFRWCIESATEVKLENKVLFTFRESYETRAQAVKLEVLRGKIEYIKTIIYGRMNSHATCSGFQPQLSRRLPLLLGGSIVTSTKEQEKNTECESQAIDEDLPTPSRRALKKASWVERQRGSVALTPPAHPLRLYRRHHGQDCSPRQ